MFETFEELTRFGASARQLLVRSIVRWAGGAAIAALLIASAQEYALVSAADIRPFLDAFLFSE